MYNRRSTQNTQPQGGFNDLAVGSRRPKRGSATQQSPSAAIVQQHTDPPVTQRQTAAVTGQTKLVETQHHEIAPNASQNSATVPHIEKTTANTHQRVTRSTSQTKNAPAEVLPNANVQTDSKPVVAEDNKPVVAEDNTSDVKMKFEAPAEVVTGAIAQKRKATNWKKRTGRNMAEVRKRQNARFGRILNPKNALSILNELKVNPEFEIISSERPPFIVNVKAGKFCFEGIGKSIMAAKNAAAELLLKSTLLEKIKERKTPAPVETGDNQDQPPTKRRKFQDQDDFPWASMACFAIYKLLENWKNLRAELPGVPIMRMLTPGNMTNGPAVSSNSKNATTAIRQKSVYDAPVRDAPTVPSLHPVSIVNCMFPGMKITEVVENNPANLTFSAVVAIGPNIFYAQGKNKKDAKKACCEKILQHYKVSYNQ